MSYIRNLLAIDPQWDFCSPDGALSVPRANEDMERLSKFINKMKDKLDDIHVSLDSHQSVHIFFPCFWINDKREHPAPFTQISKDDVKNGVWKASRMSFQKKAEEYVTKLEERGRNVLTQWPEHCIIGTIGSTVFPCVSDSLRKWEIDNFAKVNFLVKGNNPFTEHYSIIEADVPSADDPTTKVNTGFIDVLKQADEIYITGEALSHCTSQSVMDIAKYFGDDNIKKLILLEDTTSSIPGYEKVSQDFINEYTKKGMKVTRSTDF